MAKARSHFVCQQCGYESTGFLGKCPNCGSWGSLVETLERNIAPSKDKKQNFSNKNAVSLLEYSSKEIKRLKTKIDEFDQIIGGGIVAGQVILIAGNPGIGKSTLLLQIANNLKNSLYVSGEESINQIALRAKRLKVKNGNIKIIEGTDIDEIISLSENLKPDVLVIDSIQVMATSDLTGMAGSVGQVRECAFRLVRFAKSNNIPVFIIGHVTKEGSVAGPAALSHIVDSVLWFEGDKSLTLRMVRAVKNRFGPTDEVGVFEMKEEGLVSVMNPEKIFLTNNSNKIPGSVIGAIMEGSRPVLIEIESLVVASKLAFPKRVAQGIDSKKFELLLAVLTKHCRLPLYEYDCFINVAGGIIARSPAIDLAICMAVASSFFDIAVPQNVIALGEVGLLGEIRDVAGGEKIIRQAKRLGYKKMVTKKEFKTVKEVIHNFFVPSKKSN